MASKDFAEGITPSGKAAMDDEPDQISRIKAMDRVIEGAKAATEKEQKMTLLQGIRLYPKAIAWSVLVSFCIVMEGYDVCLINNFCKCPDPASSNGYMATDQVGARRVPAVQQEIRRAAAKRRVGGARPVASRAQQCKFSAPSRPRLAVTAARPLRRFFLAVFASSLHFLSFICF
jgi:hypothetical protein